jgi:hypothetical protein
VMAQHARHLTSPHGALMAHVGATEVLGPSARKTYAARESGEFCEPPAVSVLIQRDADTARNEAPAPSL